MQNDETKKIKLAHKELFILAIIALIIFAMLPHFLLHSQGQSYKSIDTKNATLSQNRKSTSLSVKNQVLQVDMAYSAQEQQHGLCCRDSLEPDAGMLFVYDKPGDYRFWMKDTRIPLDMYWVNTEKKIVHIEENVQPESYPKSFGSPKPAQYILETNAGFAKKHNIKVGDKIRF